MVRPAATGLATAFYRLYLLDALATEPARPATLLARIAAERLPLSSGGFSRALQALLEGGYLIPANEGAVALTALGAAERMAERERWRRVIPTVARLVGENDVVPRPAPAFAETAVRYRTAEVAEAYLDRVLVAALRERLAQARDGGRAFALVLGVVDIDALSEATRRAMVHRTIRATLGGSTTIFGGDTSAFRYGDAGVALVAPIVGDAARSSHLAALLQLNTRRGDWVARWGGDEFVVGLHRNRALKMVIERIVKAISASPCEIAPGLELRVSVSCGVAEYRFGSGPEGVLADADKAMYAAKQFAHADGRSHVCYRNELTEVPAPPPREAVSAN